MFHQHDWMICAATCGVMGDDKGGDVTVVLYRCPACGNNKTEVLTGHWTVPQLMGENAP
jgi:hypothetical protein